MVHIENTPRRDDRGPALWYTYLHPSLNRLREGMAKSGDEGRERAAEELCFCTQ
jgi:hypothetical protein